MGFDPVTMFVGATLLGGASEIAGGISTNAQKKAEAQQYDANAKATLTAADQADVERRTDLVSTLSAINAVRTARGLEVASPTGAVIAQGNTTRAERAIDQSNLNYRGQAQSYKTQAGVSRSQGTAALVGGFLKGGATLFKGAGDLKRYG